MKIQDVIDFDKLGGDPGFVDRECSSTVCNNMTQIPANIIKPGMLDAKVMCDECYEKSKAMADRREIEATRITVEERIKRAEIPDMLPVEPCPELLELLAMERRGVYLTGKVGTGKTSQVAEFMRRWVAEERPALYTTEFEVLHDLKDWDHQHETMHKLKTVKLLVLDEAGQSHGKEWAASTLGEIFDARYRHAGLYTVVITNFSPQELAEQNGYDQRVMRRILEVCKRAVVVQ